ncbi:serine hydrolase [Chitinophaga sp. SYP-B3965]|uniref:serine hydrolase domain-containing protein n=1 Tax=Chitinophaga sp. SYP-B3965 TaxID=2663120 RepID=UPI001299519E|nr:serine hydrolase [Chitinophaga sp. SYP-B3965]MRG48911.1 serine hydrolase [Chitinophaga sp. SYP-B3965]
MKTVFKTICITVAMFVTGCEKSPIGGIGGIGNPGKEKVFSAKIFYDNMIKAMEGKTVGYGFSIAQDGSLFGSHGGGYARLAIDAPETKYDEKTRQGIGSCSKTITAFAIFKALEAKGLDETAKIEQFLPTGWVLPAANKNLRFEDIMSHKAGLWNFGGDWAALKKTVETPNKGTGNYYYDNVNYTLCRLLLAYIVHDRKYIESSFDPNWLTCAMYLDYVRNEIFKPCGLVRWDKITIGPWAENSTGIDDLPRNMTRYYNFSQPSLNGVTKYTTLLEAGPGGFYMNPTEVAQIINAGEQYKIVSKQMMKDMKEKKLGFDGQVAGARGAYVWKNGDWDDGNPTYRGIYTVIMCFPNNVQVVFHTNSRQTKIGSDIQKVMAKAYDNAWF